MEKTPVVLCHCDFLIAREEWPYDGPNKGRHYYKCDRCCYFSFEDLGRDLDWPNLLVWYPEYKHDVTVHLFKKRSKKNQPPRKKIKCNTQ